MDSPFVAHRYGENQGFDAKQTEGSLFVQTG